MAKKSLHKLYLEIIRFLFAYLHFNDSRQSYIFEKKDNIGRHLSLLRIFSNLMFGFLPVFPTLPVLGNILPPPSCVFLRKFSYWVLPSRPPTCPSPSGSPPPTTLQKIFPHSIPPSSHFPHPRLCGSPCYVSCSSPFFAGLL